MKGILGEDQGELGGRAGRATAHAAIEKRFITDEVPFSNISLPNLEQPRERRGES